eukprot:GAHX01006354.1.p2 GENE.GAHX01006354.1~~GAHX01006354.1.p2  ORF type:complete len:51 (-),score=1.84 GAHX01006354.1:297-449(-)
MVCKRIVILFVFLINYIKDLIKKNYIHILWMKYYMSYICMRNSKKQLKQE